MSNAVFEAELLKFSDSLMVSSSSENAQVCVWETQTLAPLETFKSDKFFVGPNTLQASPTGFILGTHLQKTTLAAWRWDKTSQPIMKCATKEEFSAVRMCSNQQGQELAVCATKKGKLLIYLVCSGNLLAEVPNAHYLAINDLDLSHGNSNSARQGDFIISAGQDSKVKVWSLAELLSLSLNGQNQAAFIADTGNRQSGCYHEFSEHTGPVTAVKFSYGASLHRAFSASLDKTFKVYDLPTKMVLKSIQMLSPITKISIDQIEASAFLACENLNVYQMPLSEGTSTVVEGQQSSVVNSRKRTFTHRKRITAMNLTVDNLQLITGDTAGSIYVWNLTVEGDNSNGTQRSLLQMFDIHRDHGAITNLVPLTRPLSLFGLTANMQAYEPGEIKAFQRSQIPQDQIDEQALTVQLNPINGQDSDDDVDDDDSENMGETMAEYAELEYFCQASQIVAANQNNQGGGKTNNNNINAGKKVIAAKPTPTDDFIGMDTNNPEERKQQSDEVVEVGEIERLMEENKRLKKTLVEKFEAENDQ